MFKPSDLSPAGPRIIITSAVHQSAAERATFEMAEPNIQLRVLIIARFHPHMRVRVGLRILCRQVGSVCGTNWQYVRVAGRVRYCTSQERV